MYRCHNLSCIINQLTANNGGERGIRTLDTVSPKHAFQACAFNHSAISPPAEGHYPAFARGGELAHRPDGHKQDRPAAVAGLGHGVRPPAGLSL